MAVPRICWKQASGLGAGTGLSQGLLIRPDEVSTFSTCVSWESTAENFKLHRAGVIGAAGFRLCAASTASTATMKTWISPC